MILLPKQDSRGEPNNKVTSLSMEKVMYVVVPKNWTLFGVLLGGTPQLAEFESVEMLWQAIITAIK